MTRPDAFVFPRPERFVVGTVGQPGERAFFLQVSEAGATVSVSLEKAQVVALTEGMESLLREVAKQRGDLQPTAATFVDHAPLDTPIHAAFRVGTMRLVWDTESVVVEAAPDNTDADDPENTAAGTIPPEQPRIEDEDPSVGLRVRLDPAQAVAFVERAEKVVQAGRPTCILCLQPVDPDGHLCPRLN